MSARRPWRGWQSYACATPGVPWADRKGIAFDLLAGPEQRLIGRFGLINEHRPEQSLHAIYIIDSDGKVFYREVARRRAHADELLDAIDYHMGKYRTGTWQR